MIASIFAIVVASGMALPQQAPIPVYRCRGRHGETVLSGVACSDRSDLQQSPGQGNGFDANAAWGGRCADSAEDLSDRVAATFDSGNVNDLGALFLWRGYGTRAAYAHMNALQAMLAKPLAGLNLVPTLASTWLNNGPGGPDTAGALRVEVAIPGMGSSSQLWLFPIVERDACYWLQYAPPQDSP